MDSLNGHVMNLANSIIGVSVLAMPYCFKQCGIMLSILMLIISSIVSRLACHFLLKSAILSRRKTFEFLAFHIFGSIGKLTVEMGMIGFLLGTCIAFFVVMGDLGPEIIAEITDSHTTDTMRTSILMALALFVILPLGLLRNVSSLNGVSRATIGFYCCLVLKVIFEAVPHLFSGDWFKNVNFWRIEGILQCLPIFSMALFCQTQLFEIYQSVQNATLEKMNNLICIAVNICTGVYIFVGIFGYIAFADKPFTGNILLSFSPSFMTGVMKIGFIISVAFSFPLVIFPCRASLYSLLYKEGYSLHEGVSNYISEARFKTLTIIIVLISLIIGIVIPNIEFVLGLVGSTIGVMICVIFPVTCFISISPKSTNERLLAQIMLMVGIFVMVLGTYKNLSTMNNFESTIINKPMVHVDSGLSHLANSVDILPTTSKSDSKSEMIVLAITEDNRIKEIRHEPPQPVEPVEESVKNSLQNEEKKVTPLLVKLDIPKTMQKEHNYSKIEEVDIEAIEKEVKEELSQNKETPKHDDHQILIDTIQKQNEVQKEIVKQQKKLIEVIQSQQRKNEDNHDSVKEEKLKAVKEIETIALKAIEKISGGEDSKKVVKELEKNIHEAEWKNSPDLKNTEVNVNRMSSDDNATKMEKNVIPENKIVQNEMNSEFNIKGDTNRNMIPESSIGGSNKNLLLKTDVRKVGNPNVNIKETSNKEIGYFRTEKPKNAKYLQTNQHDFNYNQRSHNNSPIQLKNVTSNKSNDTAPLFLKLGKAEENRKKFHKKKK
ncbi:uncharacterized protein [Leptinotarsa decemlineata]|uniref:uncharacterized protein n=1 Tax=Leptinotarsa decemlineata TaxID=7539 RepID=UPI000C25363A|nr:putative sodium-coupled neutral amino acid transporter 10 [Leptinotarsa decemlineata]